MRSYLYRFPPEKDELSGSMCVERTGDGGGGRVLEDRLSQTDVLPRLRNIPTFQRGLERDQ